MEHLSFVRASLNTADLTEIAKKYSISVLMSNCLGNCGGIECAGKSSILNQEGKLMGQLNDKEEGILVLDTENGIISHLK